MINNAGSEPAIRVLFAAVRGLRDKINCAAVEDKAWAYEILSRELEGTPYGLINGSPMPPPANEDLGAPLLAAERVGGTSDGPVSQQIFEYLVLAFLRARGDAATRKAELLGLLETRVDFGKRDAITTRLNKMRDDPDKTRRDPCPGYITWAKHKQTGGITVMQAGQDRLSELTGNGPRSLSPEDRDFLARHEAWPIGKIELPRPKPSGTR